MAAEARHDFVYRRETWDRVATTDGVYGAICHQWTKERFESEKTSLFFSVESPRNAVVVDLGCGIGRVAKWVAPMVGRYIGLDYSGPMVTRARERNQGVPNATFIWSDSIAVLPDESADMIFSEQVFFHLTQQQQLRYFGEAYDVLKPGGLLLVSVPDVRNYVNGFDPCELSKLLVKYHVRTRPAGKTFILEARKPVCLVDPSVEEKRARISEQVTARVGYSPNLDNPRTFNEKVQWYKLYYRDPFMTQCADKYAVRGYVKERVGDDILPRLYGAYESVEQIDLDSLPQSFALKVNHGFKQNVLCSDKKQLDWPAAKEKLAAWIRPESNLYWQSYEWAYKNIPPRIVCEEYLADNLTDYKFFCFDGEPKFLYVATDRTNGPKFDFYDLEWQRLPFTRVFPASGREQAKPESFGAMIDVCRKLSAPFPFVRVDLYDVAGRVVFGELTFYPGNGMEAFDPPEWDLTFGKMLSFPNREGVAGQ